MKYVEPNIEERVATLEKLVFYSAVSWALYDTLTRYQFSNVWVLILLLGLFIFMGTIALLKFGELSSLVMNRYQTKFISAVLSFIDRNKSWIGYLFLSLVQMGIIIALYLLNYDSKTIVGALLIELLIYLFSIREKIVDYFKSKNWR